MNSKILAIISLCLSSLLFITDEWWRWFGLLGVSILIGMGLLLIIISINKDAIKNGYG